MDLENLLQLLGDEIETPDEETFDLFAQQIPSQNLGFIDAKASVIELTVAGRDLTIHQSPGILSSDRAGGTTGAVVWKITPLFAEWISSPSNPLFAHDVLSSSSCVIELGCGIAGIVGLLLAPRIAHYVLTDQAYVSKFIEQNIADNTTTATATTKPSYKGHHNHYHKTSHKKQQRETSSRSSKSTGGSSSQPGGQQGQQQNIHFTPLDWETDGATPELLSSSTAVSNNSKTATATATRESFDAIIACDCIYNEALVEPLVSTCADICRLRAADNRDEDKPCVCVVAQQLRDPTVFEAWLACFAESFRVWRIPDSLLTEGLRSNSGFVVHIGVLKGLSRLG
ncbi:hypothetical protein B0H66DRAFT_532802 [Apodospora peruviana]|uniref:Diaminohydroxyphosphoribosylamino-pyrimidine deaminase n=1 Tax=Apodospora peruviana TaxID=516989 RepID=A0AAE0I492_9PEZI|nr:hypothetical protein B0H66DRAFT_532802 [Apodospora peruviana]